MISRIAVYQKVPDTRAKSRQKSFQNFPFYKKIKSVDLADIYTIEKILSSEQLKKIGFTLINPVTEGSKIRIISSGSENTLFVNLEHNLKVNFNWAIEIGFLPGVTDNIGKTTRTGIEDHLKLKFDFEEDVYSSQVTFISGALSKSEIKQIAAGMYNPLIQRAHIYDKKDFVSEGKNLFLVPKVSITGAQKVLDVDLNVSDEELAKIGKEGIMGPDGKPRGPLALGLDYMHAIQNYFKSKKRNPTDIELETLAQTWSEHCKHTIFAGPLDDIQEGLFKRYIKGATEKIRKLRGKDDFCVSVFKDNSGAIEFDENFLVTHKVETHNTPSALDPFGGSITGIVGVNRDALGFGLGAKPIFNTYGFCFADPDDNRLIYRDFQKTQAMLLPKRIMEGVIAGVNAGGNQSGIPTPMGFLYFDGRYKGKPLVFCGTVGLIPKKSAGRKSWEKKAKPGDYVIMMGGKVGLDGIHGATFSSESLHSGSPSTAVQIGDPITQKKFSDAIVKEARDLGLYNSITDNGGGGLSSSVGEMAKESGGVIVNLEKVPLKYPGLDPWQIWISESQERMNLAVPKTKWKKFEQLMKSRGVGAWNIGEFTKSGKCLIKYSGKTILDLDLDFLHEGLPKRVQRSAYRVGNFEEPELKQEKDLTKDFANMLGRLNICSYDFLSTQYDHTVQGTAVTYPLQGRGRVNSEAVVVKPVYKSNRGLVLSQGYFPGYSEIDAYKMAAASVDAAFKNAVIAGANPEKIALLDNFCWPSGDDPVRLDQLKKTCEGVYDLSVAYLSPLISGKDSMFNDFKGFDDKGKPVKISVPPTLLITSLGIVDNVENAVTIDAKFPGDLIYVLGETSGELGGSEYYSMLGYEGNRIPEVDPYKNYNLYKNYTKAVEKGLIASAIGINRGGLAVALAKMSMSGILGASVNLKRLPGKFSSDSEALFSESTGRILLTIDPKKKKEFEKLFEEKLSLFKGVAFAEIGKVTNDMSIKATSINNTIVINILVQKALETYRRRFEKW
ncbi:phosphoribosylformylglycinamidine synthase [Candidatus Daviesbacteria bacterium]|nr:phosphoribosylformylglycinamidine synthase [Candidatus Daviesbacteria bacterium]